MRQTPGRAFTFGSVFSLLLALLLSSCASTYENPQLKLVSERDYFSGIDKATEKKQIYDGFMNVLDISATLMTTQNSRNQIDHKARIYQWAPEQYEKEKSKMESDLTKETVIYLSFFVPERKHDDLHKKNSNWKIFLDVAGKRYEGKAEKSKAQLSEIQSLYPHHTRWQTAYRITFNVPTVVAETGSPKFTLTGPVASTSVQFK